jgi:hypothetical protein
MLVCDFSNPPTFGSWGFDPPSRHQQNTRVTQLTVVHRECLLPPDGRSDGCWSFLVALALLVAVFVAGAAMRSITESL